MAESEAIAVAVERQATILMDENLGRTVAARFGLDRIGVLAWLVAARKRSEIPAIAPHMNSCKQNWGSLSQMP